MKEMECSEVANEIPTMEIQISSVFSLPLETYLGADTEEVSISIANVLDSKDKVSLDLSQCKGASVVLEKIDDYLMGRNRVLYRQWTRRFNRCGEPCRLKHVQKITAHLQPKATKECERKKTDTKKSVDFDTDKSLTCSQKYKLARASLNFTSLGRPKFQSLTRMMNNMTSRDKHRLNFMSKSFSKRKEYQQHSTVNKKSLANVTQETDPHTSPVLLNVTQETDPHTSPVLLNFRDVSSRAVFMKDPCHTVNAQEKHRFNDSNCSVGKKEKNQTAARLTPDNSDNALTSHVVLPHMTKIKEEPLSLRQFETGQSVFQGYKIPIKVEPGLQDNVRTDKAPQIQYDNESLHGNNTTTNVQRKSTQERIEIQQKQTNLGENRSIEQFSKYRSLKEMLKYINQPYTSQVKETSPLSNIPSVAISDKTLSQPYASAEKTIKIAPRQTPDKVMTQSQVKETSPLGNIPSLVTSGTSSYTISEPLSSVVVSTSVSSCNNQSVLTNPCKAGFILTTINGKTVLINPNAIASNHGKKPFLLNQNLPNSVAPGVPKQDNVAPGVPKQDNVAQLSQFIAINTPGSSLVGQQQLIPIVAQPNALGTQHFMPIINNAGTVGLINGAGLLTSQQQFLPVVSRADSQIAGQPPLNMLTAKQNTLLISPQVLQQNFITQNTAGSQPNLGLQHIVNLANMQCAASKPYSVTNLSSSNEKSKPLFQTQTDKAVTVVLSDAVKQPTPGFILPSGHLVINSLQQPQQANVLSYTAQPEVTAALTTGQNNQFGIPLASTQNIQLGPVLFQRGVQSSSQKTPIQNVLTQSLANNQQQAQTKDYNLQTTAKLTDSSNPVKSTAETKVAVVSHFPYTARSLIGQPRVQNPTLVGSVNSTFVETKKVSASKEKPEESVVKSQKRFDSDIDSLHDEVVTINGQQYVLVPKTDTKLTPTVKTPLAAGKMLQIAASLKHNNNQLQDNDVSSSRGGRLTLKRGPMLSGNKSPYQKTKLSTNETLVTKLKTKLERLRTESQYRKTTSNESSTSKSHSAGEKTTQTALGKQELPSREDRSADVIVLDDPCISPSKKHPRKSKPQPRMEYDDLERGKSQEPLVPSNPIMPQGRNNWPQEATIHEKKITLPDTILNELRMKPMSDWPVVGQVVPHKSMID